MISILIFTRDDAEWLGRCLEALRALPPESAYEVLVFDNVSTDGTDALVRAWRGAGGERALLFQATQDSSFSRGNNVLLRAARGETVLFLNPDTEVAGAVIDAAQQALTDDPTITLVGPSLVFEDGSAQSNGWTRPTPVQLVRERFGAAREVPASGTGRTDVGWLMGCFLMGRTADMRRFGGFDERYWFLATDLELCARVGRRGRVVRLDEHTIVHRGHRAWPASRRRASRRATLGWLARSGLGIR